MQSKLFWRLQKVVNILCLLLIAFGNSLDPDQDRQNVGPDLDPICLILW